MTITLTEGVYGCNINFTPETPEEVAKLARIAKSSKREPASINFFFSELPYLNIHMKKTDPNKQNNYISNKKP